MREMCFLGFWFPPFVCLLGFPFFSGFMSQQRQFQIMGGNNDTTFTKIFVGGLAWETQRDTMRRYFEQFGEIQEAVVITDKNTGRSKGYGFVSHLFLLFYFLFPLHLEFAWRNKVFSFFCCFLFSVRLHLRILRQPWELVRTHLLWLMGGGQTAIWHHLVRRKLVPPLPNTVGLLFFSLSIFS